MIGARSIRYDRRGAVCYKDGETRLLSCLMRESDAQVIFKKRNVVHGVFELKIAKKKSLPFSSVAAHQIDALLEVSSDSGHFHKISDSPWTQRFTMKKPFDCFFLRNEPAFVVIFWYKPRKMKEFHYIPIAAFVEEASTSKRKSLTYGRSVEISTLRA